MLGSLIDHGGASQSIFDQLLQYVREGREPTNDATVPPEPETPETFSPLDYHRIETLPPDLADKLVELGQGADVYQLSKVFEDFYDQTPDQQPESSQAEFDLIEAFKRAAEINGTPIVSKSGKRGTTVVIHVDGTTYFGVNSTPLTEAEKALAKQWRDEFGWSGPQERVQAQMLFHAEAQALMRAYIAQGGEMPKNIKMHSDNRPCNYTCKKNLQHLVSALGLDELVIELQNGNYAVVNPGKRISYFLKGGEVEA